MSDETFLEEWEAHEAQAAFEVESNRALGYPFNADGSLDQSPWDSITSSEGAEKTIRYKTKNIKLTLHKGKWWPPGLYELQKLEDVIQSIEAVVNNDKSKHRPGRGL